MKNIKDELATAFSSDSELLNLVSKNHMFDGVASFKDKPVFPYLVYYELLNKEGQQADNEEIESEITIRVDIYGTSSLSIITGHVDRIMKSLEFTRNYFRDLDESTDTGIIKHKVGSFTGSFKV